MYTLCVTYYLNGPKNDWLPELLFAAARHYVETPFVFFEDFRLVAERGRNVVWIYFEKAIVQSKITDFGQLLNHFNVSFRRLELFYFSKTPLESRQELAMPYCQMPHEVKRSNKFRSLTTLVGAIVSVQFWYFFELNSARKKTSSPLTLPIMRRFLIPYFVTSTKFTTPSK
jgi:hypothetical protein